MLQVYFCGMFIRKLKNRSSNVSIQIISKAGKKYRVVKTIGCGKNEQEIELLYQQARQELVLLEGKQSLFVSIEDAQIEAYLQTLTNAQVQVVGPELVFGKIYDHIGFGVIKEELFRHLVITRLFHPGSKLKTIDYLLRYQSIHKTSDAIYRFLDKLRYGLKQQVEDIAFAHTLKLLKGKISVVFYDMTTLYFEASQEDDLRKTGFSKVGKHQNPQIYLGLLVGIDGYAIGYDIFEGNIFEGNTLIPVLQKFEKRFNIIKPIVVADAGLLSNSNIALLEQQHYHYILGGRIKNESQAIRAQIQKVKWADGHRITIKKENRKLIVAYSDKRAAKDEHNRKRGLKRLEKNLKSGKLTKSQINNKGYNKYLSLIGELNVVIDYNKFEQDKQWDGLKGYITNAPLSSKKIIDNYKQLWQIEKAFRISKTDLEIRPIYHRLRHRIEAHICIAFTAYCIYKELERILKKKKSHLSVKRAAELTHTMYQLKIILPDSKHQKNVLLNMSDDQTHLYQIIHQNF